MTCMVYVSKALPTHFIRVYASHTKRLRGDKYHPMVELKNLTTYRKRKDHDEWHWCTNCNNWPTSDYTTYTGTGRPPTDELDNECLAKEKAGNCDT